jgi:aminomethyltransferase
VCQSAALACKPRNARARSLRLCDNAAPASTKESVVVPLPTPFHARTSAACASWRWKDWAGYAAVCSFATYPEREYFAFRHAAGLIDVTPLYKYDVRGADAAAFLSRVLVRDVRKLAAGRVAYACWCDAEGKLLDDGTVSRFEADRFRLTSAEPAFAWLSRHTGGLRVSVEDETDRVATLSLQGPLAREILRRACDAQVDRLKFFGLTRARFDGFEATVTRTGYTGDLGYEIWVANEHALPLWDRLADAGAPFGLLPCGLDAMDMTRVEAGFILNGIDYFPATRCLVEARKSTPFEAGLDWTVQLERDAFVGQPALLAEKAAGPKRRFVGLSIDWDETEALWARHGLPPEIHPRAWRTSIPVYDRGGRFVGQATSGTWSPLLKQNLALATVRAPHGEPGEELLVETTVEYERHRVKATVRPRPFFDPERKRT